MDDGAGRYPSATMRASDADRDAVLAELSEHFQAGRLTSDELDERTGQALQARTFGELARLTADLPSLAPAGSAAGQAGNQVAIPGRARQPAVLPLVLGLVAVALVLGGLIGTGPGAQAVHLWWLILVVPLVARRMRSRGRR
jgi:hypothetical protein